MFPKVHYSCTSLEQLCDDGCFVTLTKYDLIVKENNQIFLEGNISFSGDKLWDIPLLQHQHQNYNISYPTPTLHSLNI